MEYTVRVQASIYTDIVVDVDLDELEGSNTDEAIEATAREYAEELFGECFKTHSNTGIEGVITIEAYEAGIAWRTGVN